MSRRFRDLGLGVGTFPIGRHNAITDVPGVKVGHATVRHGQRVRTGVTVILPGVANPHANPVPAAVRVFNGHGKLTGSLQVQELGALETPIAMTGTLNVWRVADALVEYVLALPGNERVLSLNPVVAETNDAYLSDARSRPVGHAEVQAAFSAATDGPVTEGSVGGGTAAIALGYKAGIGTASRVVADITLGVLVQANFGGTLHVLGKGIDGTDVKAEAIGGSCVFVVATDAPIDARMLGRVAQRTLFGLARCGADGSSGSGDYAIAFSTSRTPATMADAELDDVFLATADAAEESIYNALLAARPERRNGKLIPALTEADVLGSR